ncbi:MAG: SRPBCC family protein [Polyangiales bacterium]
MTRLTSIGLVLGAAALCSTHLHAHAAPAAPAHDARTDRLKGLSKADLALLEPQLQVGPVALVEFADDDADELPAINLAAIVHAPAQALMALVERPEGYPSFMHTLDRVEVAQRDGASTTYDWRWNLALLSLQGRNSMTTFPPPPDRADVGYRTVIDSVSGDLGTGRISLRVLPRSANESLLCISLRLDLRSANYVARQLASAARSVNRSADMALTYAMVLSFREEAERRAGHHAQASAAGGLQKPQLDLKALWPLLMRGDLVLLDVTGARLNRIAAVGVIHQDAALVHKVLLDTEAFGDSLLPGSEAKVVSRRGAVTIFDWDISLPLIGVSGRMKVSDADPVVSVDAVDGAMHGGRWSFETLPLGKDLTVLSAWASFDLRDTTWFVRGLANADPGLGHGMSAASEILLVRGVRTEAVDRAEREAKARKAH